MSPWLALGAAWIAAMAVAWRYVVFHSDTLIEDIGADSKAFQAYVERELMKAQAGAVNAEQWAKDLVVQWELKR